jgi:hypothetical protein
MTESSTNTQTSYFTVGEINSIYKKTFFGLGSNQTNQYNANNKVLTQIKKHVEPNIDINVDSSKYDKIYAIGDIHADYIRFYNLLLENMLIKGEPMTEENQYEPSLITDVQWNNKRTLLVICGDLVDGKRDGNSVKDPRGSFELLIFIFLFDLKHKAKQNESDVIFIFGNHDAMIFEETNYRIKIYKDYMHDTAKKFWWNGNDDDSNYFINRRNTLAEFYKISPYMLYNVNSKTNEKKITFLHAGFTDISKRDDYENQNTNLIKNLKEKNIINNDKIFSTYLSIKKYGNEDLLWNRKINDLKSEYYCNEYIKDKTNTTFVVGHCPTISAFGGLELKETPKHNCDHSHYVHPKSKINEAEKFNCIHPTCFNKDDYPNVIMIDVALSYPMSCINENNQCVDGNQNLEILLIEIKKDDISFYSVRKGDENNKKSLSDYEPEYRKTERLEKKKKEIQTEKKKFKDRYHNNILHIICIILLHMYFNLNKTNLKLKEIKYNIRRTDKDEMALIDQLIRYYYYCYYNTSIKNESEYLEEMKERIKKDFNDFVTHYTKYPEPINDNEITYDNIKDYINGNLIIEIECKSESENRKYNYFNDNICYKRLNVENYNYNYQILTSFTDANGNKHEYDDTLLNKYAYFLINDFNENFKILDNQHPSTDSTPQTGGKKSRKRKRKLKRKQIKSRRKNKTHPSAHP